MRLRADPYGRLHAFDVYYRDLIADHSELVRRWTIRYNAWDGMERTAYVVLPRWLRRLGPRAPVREYVGDWAHSKEFHASARLPLALVEVGLIHLSESIPRPDRIDRAGG